MAASICAISGTRRRDEARERLRIDRARLTSAIEERHSLLNELHGSDRCESDLLKVDFIGERYPTRIALIRDKFAILHPCANEAFPTIELMVLQNKQRKVRRAVITTPPPEHGDAFYWGWDSMNDLEALDSLLQELMDMTRIYLEAERMIASSAEPESDSSDQTVEDEAATSLLIAMHQSLTRAVNWHTAELRGLVVKKAVTPC